ncbi:TetR/AcrR family transcriptional regulator [Tenggerimyces flavus]|uniref:TetR/AcrR family transcriptional regulator n=1 Tax=Tenggerimyces flavus TaxID=1708749 RepID=A0ABV7Y7S7_9ACTN|nr:TetR/AcrR family transcriptional regulator [Tenggerimyces flavus]MBM7785290.1 AcrR family transcriptional regulator [Tenggerimyces flavus]
MPRIKGDDHQRAAARSQLRADILTAARELAEQAGGYEPVTMRQVAERVGYTAPVVYEYFASKRELLVGVLTEGFERLASQLAEAGPTKRAAAGALWDFANAHPRLYLLMHNLVDIPFGTPETPEPARRCFDLLREAVAAASPAHADLDDATDLFWAQTHGLIVLSLAGRIKGGRDRARALLDEVGR